MHDGRWAEVVHPAHLPPALHFQWVSEPKVGKNRMHLDLVVDDLPAEVARMTGLGATVLTPEHEDQGCRLAVLADPQGNEFCLVHPPA